MTVSKPWEHAKSGGSEQNELAARFVESISYDTRMYKQDIAGSIAHARMLEASGLITANDLVQIESGLHEIQGEIEASNITDWSGWNVQLEDVHMCIEAALIDKVGEAGRKLHTGRSRNDQVALDLKLWIESAVEQLAGDFRAVYDAFVALANRDGEITMPSYTHLQRAQPIVVGGELMAWLSAFERAESRFVALRDLNRQNPLGSGAIAGSSLPLDRSHTAAALPVGPPTYSSMDATASRDAAIDFVYAMAMTSMTMSRWAEQWIIYMSTEFGFVQIGDAFTTGSSMMPQKRNPDMLELIRGRCGNVYGSLMSLLTMCKGITIGYNRDMQEDKRHVFAAFDVVRDCLRMTAGIVVSASFNGDRIADGIDRGYADATSLAEYLVSRGVPFRTAHQHVGKLVRRCDELGLTALSELPLPEMQAVCDVIDESLTGWLGADNVVQQYRSSGNAGISGFREGLAYWSERLQS